MPRSGKGCRAASIKDWGKQASRLLGSRQLDLSSRHAAKQSAGIKGNQSTGKIHSLATLAKYTQVLKNAGEWIGPTFGVTRLDQITPAQAQAYLEHRAEFGIGQKQLDADRSGLQRLRNVGELQRVIAAEPRKLEPRAYTPQQIGMFVQHQTERNALASELSYRAGLRAHELFTLQRSDEASRSYHREWRDDRFKGRSGEVYLVTGKGGLTREVLVPHDLVERLEIRRLEVPNVRADLKLHYTTHYDVGGGNAWSVSVRTACKSELGWTTGAHGLRHSYVQERIEELQGLGYTFGDAKCVVSQELGHFRPDVINTYLR